MKLLEDTSEIIVSGESPDSCGQQTPSFNNDIDQLFEAMDLKTRVKEKYASMKSKSTLKRPMKIGISDSESASLKQALRGICLSQASSLAAQRRRSSKLLPLSSQSKKFMESHKIREDVQVCRENGESSQSSNSSSIGEYSSSTSVSESLSSNISGSNQRPHMSKDSRWEAIRCVRNQNGYLDAGDLKVLKKLGCGDIATVYLAELISTKCLFALKVMDNQFLVSKRKIGRAETELEILQMLDHPFLPTLYSHFRTDKLSCLVMEYCPGGDLHELRQKQPARCFSEQATRFYAAEVLLALEYLHMLGVVYRDLKPENVLVREDGHIMLTDFDLSLRCAVNARLVESSLPPPTTAKKLPTPNACAESATSCLDPAFPVSCFATAARQKSDLAAAVLLQVVAEPTCARSDSFVGTHEYLAPEIIKGEGHGNAVDWWTFGIFLYELLYGRTPFRGAENEDTLMNVVSRSLKFPERPVVTFDARDLIRRLLAKEPEKRLGCVKGATEVKQHPFFQGMNWALIRCATPPEIPKVEDDDELESTEMKKNKSLKEFIDAGEELGFNDVF